MFLETSPSPKFNQGLTSAPTQRLPEKTPKPANGGQLPRSISYLTLVVIMTYRPDKPQGCHLVCSNVLELYFSCKEFLQVFLVSEHRADDVDHVNILLETPLMPLFILNLWESEFVNRNFQALLSFTLKIGLALES